MKMYFELKNEKVFNGSGTSSDYFLKKPFKLKGELK